MTPKPTTPTTAALHPLLKLRQRAGLNLTDIAKACRVSNSTPMRWEDGTVEPRPRQREVYAKLLGISVEKLGSIIYKHRVDA